MGISYGGISQLFTAQTNPPSLAAISPLSVIDSTQTTLYPGGILNTGFGRLGAGANPRRRAGVAERRQPWAYQRIQEGDATCKANQDLHPEAVDLMAKIRANDHYVPAVADPLSPTTFVNKINVPVFMACQWTDEQTGGHCPDLADRFTGTPRKWFVHQRDARRLARPGDLQPVVRLPAALRRATGADRELRGHPRRRARDLSGGDGHHGRDDAARPDPAAAHVLDRAVGVRAPAVDSHLFDSGAGGAQPGHPPPASSARGRASRSRELRPGRGIGPNGALSDSQPTGAGAESFTWNAHARPLTNFTGDTAGGPGACDGQPPYQWTQSPPGSAVSYLTSPLSGNTTMIGAGAVRLWVRSSTPNVDLQVTISEVRPDGKETFVQSGWVRANERKLDAAKSTPLEPVLSLREADVSPMPPNRFVEVTIPLYYQARLPGRLANPGHDRSPERRPAHLVVRRDGPHRNRHGLDRPLQADAVPGPPAGGAGRQRSDRLPPCPGLRGEPCRNHQPFVNLHGDAYRLARRARTGRRTCSSFLRPDSGKGCPARLAPAGSRGRRARRGTA